MQTCIYRYLKGSINGKIKSLLEFKPIEQFGVYNQKEFEKWCWFENKKQESDIQEYFHRNYVLKLDPDIFSN